MSFGIVVPTHFNSAVKMGKTGEGEANLSDMLRALNSVCTELDLIAVQSETYVPESHKWIVQARAKNSKEFYVLEFFSGLHRGLRFKFLDGSPLMGFEFVRRFDDIHCFGYESTTSVPQWIAKVRSVSNKELGMVPILENVLRGMFLLACQRLGHQRLTLENVRMTKDGRAGIGALELVMPEVEVRMNDMASLAHMPPELLTFWTLQQRHVVKIQMWILGSELLEVLIGKHISGKAFHPHDPKIKLSRRRVLKNIRRNVRYLPFVLAASDLSFQMQDFLVGLLTFNPNQRFNVLRAMMFFGKNGDCASSIGF